MNVTLVVMESNTRIIIAVAVTICAFVGIGFTIYINNSGSSTTTYTTTESTTTTPTTMSSPHTPLLEWNVSIGDTLVYQFVENATWAELGYDLGIVNLTITQLPDLPDIITADSFVSIIMDKVEFSCIYANGTEITAHHVGDCYLTTSFYSYYVSKTLFPVSDWEYIDSLFVDVDEFTFVSTTAYMDDRYYGELSGDYFTFGYTGYTIDAYDGMKMTVDILNGISIYFSDFEYHENFGYEIDGVLLCYDPV